MYVGAIEEAADKAKKAGGLSRGGANHGGQNLPLQRGHAGAGGARR